MEKNEFSEEEVREILAKGLSYQNASDDARLKIETKLSLEELGRLANEVGISPKHLQQAIEQEKNRTRVFQNDDFLGGPNNITFSSSIKGELDDSGIVEIVKKLRSIFNLTGTLETVGRHFSWSVALGDQFSFAQKQPAVDIFFEGKSADDSTDLKMTYSPTSLKYRFHVVASFLSLFVIPIFVPQGISLPLFLALLFPILLATNLGAYFAFKKFFNYRSRKIFEQFKEIEELALTLAESKKGEVESRIRLDQAEGYQSNSETQRSSSKTKI